ncbi:transposase family protein [Bacteroidales bacterium OttesenSCG-928-A17]|nr:transposase family protein [Bacteroidales bacterium OttesenSCG-928-A17]
MLSQEDVFRVFLPSWLFDYFELIKFSEEEDGFHFYLDEKKMMPASSDPLISHGFTDYSIVQDFPIKGKAVYLHLRRRKWLNQSTGEIISRRFDVAYEGTRLTKDFVAFLKATNRK